MIELIPLVAGGIFGALVKMISISMENKRRQTEALIQLQSKRQESIDKANNIAQSSHGFAITRRIIALTLTGLIAFVVFAPVIDANLPIYVQETATSGGSYLFGLINTTITKETWQALSGFVMHPVMVDSFQVVVGAYFGASIAGRS